MEHVYVVTVLGSHLMKKWGIDEFHLLQCIKQGLKPHGGSFNTRIQVERLKSLGDTPSPEALSIVQRLQFSKIDVHQFEKDHRTIAPAQNPQRQEFFITVIEDTKDCKGRETKRKGGPFTAQQIDPISFKHALEILGLDAEDLFLLLETGNILAFRRIVYGPGEAPLRYKDTPPGEANYDVLWPYEYRSLDTEDLKKLYFCRTEVEKLQSKSITPAKITEFADEDEKQLSDSAKAKRQLHLHVIESVKSGLITCKDDLFRDPVIQTIMSDMNWSKGTVERYTRDCGIPNKKLGRPKVKNGTNTP